MNKFEDRFRDALKSIEEENTKNFGVLAPAMTQVFLEFKPLLRCSTSKV